MTNLMKEYIEFTIPNGTVIGVDWNKEPTFFNRICLEKEIDIQDEDFGSHFSSYPKLEEFVVLDKDSTFFTHQGCLYKRVQLDEYDDGSYYLEHIYNICGDIYEDQQGGCILICCPQSNPIKDIVLPEDCIAIAGSAFYKCDLHSIWLPNSLYTSAIGAFGDLKVNTIYVPNKFGSFAPESNNLGKDVEILCNVPLKPMLSKEMELYWMCVFNEEIWYEHRKGYRDKVLVPKIMPAGFEGENIPY